MDSADHAGKQIDDSGQIKPDFTGAQVSEVADHSDPWHGLGDVALALLIKHVVADGR